MKFVAFLLLFLAALTSLVPDGAAQIKLNEILADPNSDWSGDGEVNSKLDEWVEIINDGAAAVDLSAFRISDLSAGTDFRFGLSGMLGPGETRVFYGADVVAWQTANGVSAFGLSLNNSGDTVYLYQVTAVDTSVVDSYPYATNQVKDDRSVGRYPDGGGTWAIFDGLNPYNGTDYPVASGCFPSPGAVSNCPTPVKTSSWGQVKSKYSK
ncbi:MAG: lamin tail domain-containing protein [Candidatus Krumholzibacteria bacterium]|nr:lamin tail domain-containing protein [Candidatus Krumholzibacteria bacterium]